MSAATAIPYHTSFKFSTSPYTRFKSSPSISVLQFPASKPVFFTGFSTNILRRQNSRTEMVKIFAFSSSNGGCDDGVGMLEEEASMNRSSLSSGLESMLNQLSKWLVPGVFSAIILWRHDAEALWAATGYVVNLGLSVTLKRLLNQERPVSAQKLDPGMPSSHAQFIFFSGAFAILSVVQRLGLNAVTMSISGLALAFGAYLSWLRVSHQLHTTSQVVVGAVMGSIFSLLWFWSWAEVVHKAYMSSVWVRIFVVIGAAAFWLGYPIVALVLD